MATIEGRNEPSKALIPVAEQTMLLKKVLELVEGSALFKGYKLTLNFVNGDNNGVCIRIPSNLAVKTKVYVDSSYEAELTFQVILRATAVSGVYDRVNNLDMVNQLGIYFEELNEQGYDTFDIDSIVIDDISQSTQAGVIYRGDNGIEDVGANFIMKYSKTY